MDSLNLIGLYGHENLLFSQGVGGDHLAYYIHYFYNRNGVVDNDEFRQLLFDELLSEQQRDIYAKTKLLGPFDVFSELEQFSIDVASALKSDAVSLLSLSEFNECAVNSADVDNLFMTLENHAHPLTDPDQQGRKHFFSTLFKTK